MEVPASFLKALAIVQCADPSALLGGGALRDTFLGRPVKDVDIFVGPEFNHWKLYEAARGCVLKTQLHFGDYGPSRPDLPHISDIWELQLDGEASEPPLQIIKRDHKIDPYEFVSSFDFGFNQVGLAMINGENRYIYTPAFWQDVRAKTATIQITARDPNHIRSVRRAKRLREKYPDFQFMTQTHEGCAVNLEIPE